MPTRREFLAGAAALAGAGLMKDLLGSVARAAAIEPDRGSSFLDAEHIVILMQENRSFDHTFGSLKGVRGFNDPRAMQLLDGHSVWTQRNAAGERFAPFRLNLLESKTSWMGCLPHAWADQVDAANLGKHDRWLDVKKSGKNEYAAMPLTMGYHTREDIPFYYALADAFTICDQNFCSTLTGTTPNRLHLWTGTIRAKPSPDSPALVRNQDCEYGHWCDWTTFPERLEDVGVSWKFYQNELFLPTGLSSEASAWLSNFGCNPLEWFTQYHVRFVENYRKHIEARIPAIPGEIDALQKQLEKAKGDTSRLRRRIEDLTTTLERYKKDRDEFTAEGWHRLAPRAKSLHARAFCTNSSDVHYRELAEMMYQDGGENRSVNIPKGDILHQFRKDVAAGQLPTVSWLAAPERYSDHPCSAWYGQWYLSEVLNILTKNPAVWKKTVFILTYDENDGYFDHVPPFQAPHPVKPETGKVSAGIDTSLEHLELEADRKQHPTGAVRGNSLGLGFRVPMIIASPWSRGGAVCSQVFDHTSVLRFLEVLLSRKTGKQILESNITQWRRTVCGDLTSAFQGTVDQQPGLDTFVSHPAWIQSIHKAQTKPLPAGFHALTESQLEQVRTNPRNSILPRQEPGVRRSCPLPYELEVNGGQSEDRGQFRIELTARNALFQQRASGAPFIVYDMASQGMPVRHYAVTPGNSLVDSWNLADLPGKKYHFRVHGPNGFYREFIGGFDDPLQVKLTDTRIRPDEPMLIGDADLLLINQKPSQSLKIEIREMTYNQKTITLQLGPSPLSHHIEAQKSGGWYDVVVTVPDARFTRRFSGRVETGRMTISDPAMA